MQHERQTIKLLHNFYYKHIHTRLPPAPNPARPGCTFAAYESVIRREYLEELRRPLAV